MKYIFACMISLMLLVSGVSHAQTPTRTLVEGTGAVVNLSRSASSIFIGDPSIADVRVVSGESLFLAGISPGTTNVFVLDFEERLIAQYRVRVVANNSEAATTLRSGVPNGNIGLGNNGSVAIIKGEAQTLDEAFAALDARRSLEADERTVVDRTTLKGGTQVSLKVRFVEASRSDLRQLGVDLAAIGTLGAAPVRITSGADPLRDVTEGLLAGIDSRNVDAVLTALDRRSVVEILSEPTLTTTSGKRASFRSGGEFGFPVNQGDGVIGTEYKQYGVSIEFLPTVLPNNRIALEVKPEVSVIDSGTDLTDNALGYSPSLSVRRAETTVEVGSGQTFAIAGLYEQYSMDRDEGVPGANRVPLFGRLLNNETRVNSERELVIFITPYLAEANDGVKHNRRPAPNIANTVGFIAK